MIGTIVNCTAIIIGSILGTILKNGIKEKYKDIMLKAMGLSAALLGVSSAVKGINDSNYPVLFIISLAIGGLIGEALALEKRVNNLTSKFSKGNLIEGLSTAVLLFCAGALSILGPLESALNGNNTLLYTNAILDGITSVVLASNYGIGIGISAFVLFIWQGSIYLCADIISPYITPALLNEISIIGGVLILSSGLNILQIKKINVLNLLPSLLVPVTYFFIKSLI